MAEGKSLWYDFLDPLLKRMPGINTPPHAVSSVSRTLSLRWYLVLLVAGTLLPVVLFAAAVVHQLSSQEQAASERRILRAAHNLAGTVEDEFSSTIRTLEALASSEQLSQGNLKAFHREATRVVQTQPSWVTVILLSPKGQQVVNTTQAFGLPLPQAADPASLQRVVQTQQPTTGDLKPSLLQPNTTGFPIRIPVMRDNQIQYVLTAVINQKAIARAIEEQSTVDGEWTRVVVDNQGVVVARTRNPERFVGKRGTPSFLKRIGESREGVYRETTLEGMKVYLAFHRVDHSGWTAAVTVPVEVIQGPTRRAMGLVVGSGLFLLGVSGIGAFILSRQISRSITAAAAAAETLANGDYPQVSARSIKEVVLLGQSLEFAANLLAQRERERAENLRRAEAAREEAETTNRIKDEFLAVLSHELRTPLSPILGWSKLLRSGGLNAEKTAFALETIERNAQLQTQLIGDLLDVSQILKGKLSLKMAPINLVPILEAAIENVRLAAEAKSIQIQTTFDPITERVLGDDVRLQQVIWNLLANAVKFTAERGTVQIHLQRIGSQAHIQVCDTGKGIHPHFLPHVFEYFRQEDGTANRHFGGLGLGLAIVRQLVELHGGTVQAESPGAGQGATFTVELPLLRNTGGKASEETPGSSSLTFDASTLRGLRVLLVDDEVDTRDFIAFLLEQRQASVTIAASGKEALQTFDQTNFDLVISDIGMPEMDGYRLIQQIRSRPAEYGGQVNAIALTAYAGESNQQQALRAGFQHHVAKPVEPDTLVEVILDLVRPH